MLKRVALGLAILAGLSQPSFPQQSCDPQKLANAIDTYASAPFSARTWRVLKGLGDPMIEMGYPGSDSWAARDTWAKLVEQISPDAPHLKNVGYDCRIGYPLEVLQQRVQTLGRESPYVEQWLRVQDKVMEACTSPEGADLSLPDKMAIHPALAAMQDEDRAYQEASIAFYVDKAKAMTLFRAIGQSASPHRGAARYNVANLLANARNLDEARNEANAILADPSLTAVHGITRELLGYIANLEDTAEGWTNLIDTTVGVIEAPKIEIMASAEKRREYANALYDIGYAGIRGKDDDWWLDGRLPEDATISKAIVDASRRHPIALWMMAGQSANRLYDAGPWSLIGPKWQERTSTIVEKALTIKPTAEGLPPVARDMLEALAARPEEQARKKLWGQAHRAMAAAEASCGNDSQTAAAGFLLSQAVRLSAMSGNYEEAISELEKVPFKGAAAFYQDSLLKLGQYVLGQGRLAEARVLRDRLLTPQFIAELPETARSGMADRFGGFMGWIAEDEAHWKNALALRSQKLSSILLNFLPAKRLWSYADEAIFTAEEKALLARAAWTRGYARGLTPTAAATGKLLALNPELRELSAKTSTDYPKANQSRLRLLTILRSPRFGILTTAPGLWDGIAANRDNFNAIDDYDPNDKNWWCPFETDRQLAGLRLQFDEATGLDFIDQYGSSTLKPVLDEAVRDDLDRTRDAVLRGHPMVKAINWPEIAALAKVPSAPKVLTLSAIRWGKASNGDDGAPEALALAVRTTRYGCRWHGRHGEYSKAAYGLLHAKFGATPWAKQTPYWFDCQRLEWNADDSGKVRICETKTWPKQAPLK
jgi:hypothetical protein